MEHLSLVSEDDPILSRKCEEFDFSSPPFNAKEFAQQLYLTMTKYNGLGLSACQVGVPYSIFALRIDANPLVMFNPRIIDVSENNILLDEGCLSFPVVFLKVQRPDWVKIRYQTFTGETYTEKYVGMTARVILHEYDHTQGITFLSRVSKLKLDRALKKQRILKNAHKKAHIDFFQRQRLDGTIETVPQVTASWYEKDVEVVK